MEGQKTVVERSASCCIADKEPKKRISELMDDFLDYARYDLNFSPQTIIKYKDALRCFARDIGDKDVETLDVREFVKLKRIMMHRGVGEARISSIVYAMRSFLEHRQNTTKLSGIFAF
jgi:site-specific recombinase XerC